MRYIKDDGQLQLYLEKVLERHQKTFAELKDVKILLLYFESKDKPGEPIVYGRARKADKRLKDIFGYDAVIEINRQKWREMSPKQKKKLIFHELCHLGIVVNEKTGERKIVLRRHDFELQRFKKELLTFGLDQEELEFLNFLKEVQERQKKKKRRKKK